MKNYILIPSDMRNQDEVLDLLMSEGPSGYGVFIMICEFLRECENYKTRDDAKRLAFALRIQEVSLVDRVLHNYDLFKVHDDGMVECPIFTASMSGYDKKREANKAAAAARWAKREQQNGNNANAMQTHEAPQRSAVQAQSESRPNNINGIVENSTNQSQIVDFGGGVTVERSFLEKISREQCVGCSESLLEHIGSMKSAMHNGNAVVEIARAFKLSEGQTKLLYKITRGGEIGNPNTEDALLAMRSAKKMTTPVKFPFNYILSKLRNYEK